MCNFFLHLLHKRVLVFIALFTIPINLMACSPTESKIRLPRLHVQKVVEKMRRYAKELQDAIHLDEKELMKRFHKLIQLAEKEFNIKFDIDYFLDFFETELKKQGVYIRDKWRSDIVNMYRRHKMRKKAVYKLYKSIPNESGYIPSEKEENAFIDDYIASKGYERREDAYSVPFEIAAYTTVFLAGAFLATIGTIGLSVGGVGAPAVYIGGALMEASFFAGCMCIAKENLTPENQRAE